MRMEVPSDKSQAKSLICASLQNERKKSTSPDPKIPYLFAVRCAFSAQVKVEEQNSDERSGTEEDSDNAVNGAATGGGTAGVAASGGGIVVDAASITDYNGYENIFRPRRRELNRTPPMEDEPFQAPMSGSESESNSRPSHLRLQMQKQVSSGAKLRVFICVERIV